MDIRITRREVLNNLIRFKDSLLETRERGKRGETLPKERKYRALLNRKTGDIRFAKKISDLHISSSSKTRSSFEDWKEIFLIVEENESRPIAHFEILDISGRSIERREVEELAWRVVSETLTALNQKGEELEVTSSDSLVEELVLKDLSSIHLVSGGASLEDLPGWMGSLGRNKAEEMLFDQPVGTYLLREGDEITLSFSFHIAEENRTTLHPYLLTFVDKEEKISEILLLHTGKGWTHFSDDPDLSRPFYHYYATAEELLKEFKAIAKLPILRKAS